MPARELLTDTYRVYRVGAVTHREVAPLSGAHSSNSTNGVSAAAMAEDVAASVRFQTNCSRRRPQ